MAPETLWAARGAWCHGDGGWDIWPGSPLKIQLLPVASISPVPASFTVGSTKDEVLAVQGTPTRVTERLWEYGASLVFFTDNRVTRWNESWTAMTMLTPAHTALHTLARLHQA